MIHKNTQNIRRWGSRPRLFALIGLVLLAGLVLSQCGSDGVSGSGGGTNGDDGDPPPPIIPPPPPRTPFSADLISAGYEHTCAVASGQALCWGFPRNGALGNGVRGGGPGTVRYSPVAVGGVTVGGMTPSTSWESLRLLLGLTTPVRCGAA